jgi:hypothetical protein
MVSWGNRSRSEISRCPMAITITFTFQDQDREFIGIVLSYSVQHRGVLRGGTILGRAVFMNQASGVAFVSRRFPKS